MRRCNAGAVSGTASMLFCRFLSVGGDASARLHFGLFRRPWGALCGGLGGPVRFARACRFAARAAEGE